MLTSVNVTAENGPGLRVSWTVEEWHNIATKLAEKYPKWRDHDFTMDEFDDAMEEVISQERQRSFTDIDDVRPFLITALQRMEKLPKAKLKPTNERQRLSAAPIRWEPKEWEEVVVELHRLNPTAFSERLVKIGIRHVEESQKVLHKSLHRHFVQVVGFRAQALKIWDALPADVRNPELQERPIVDFPSGPVMAPVAKKSDSLSAMASAMQKGFQAPQNLDKERKKHVTWSAKEWIDVAREMHRQNPNANYFSSSFFVLDMPAIRDAQRVALPLNRRKALKNTAGIRLPLIEAFKQLHGELLLAIDAEVEAEAAELKAEAKVEIAPIEAKPEPAPVPIIAAPVVAEIRQEPQPVAQFQNNDFLGGLLDAMAPLAQFLVTEAAKQMAPALIQAMIPELKKTMGPMIEEAIKDAQNRVPVPMFLTPAPVVAAPVSAPAVVEKPAIKHFLQVAAAPVAAQVVTQEYKDVFAKPADKLKKPLITILGPMGSDVDAIRRGFKEFDFRFIHHGHGIKEAANKAELFICAIQVPPQNIKNEIKKYVDPDKVRYMTNNGVAAIKRQINAWQAAKAFA